MKASKAFMVLLALLFAFICFNTPAITAGGDEHPWDQEGSGTGGSGSIGGDTLKTGINPGTALTGGKNDPSSGTTASLLVTVRFFFWYRDIPGTHFTKSRGVERNVKNTVKY